MAEKISYQRKKQKAAQVERARNRKRLIKIKKHLKPVNKILEQIDEEVGNIKT